LSYSDRLQSQTLRLTQETLADLLGVRRSSLSVVAVNLRQRKLIHYNRGKIMILDSEALRQICCGCDRLISQKYTRLLSL
ncbi:MAG: helix-turn-helix domain-containing protein, partial [Cyanobacteria bacterium P01_A01_bin.40]